MLVQELRCISLQDFFFFFTTTKELFSPNRFFSPGGFFSGSPEVLVYLALSRCVEDARCTTSYIHGERGAREEGRSSSNFDAEVCMSHVSRRFILVVGMSFVLISLLVMLWLCLVLMTMKIPIVTLRHALLGLTTVRRMTESRRLEKCGIINVGHTASVFSLACCCTWSYGCIFRSIAVCLRGTRDQVHCHPGHHDPAQDGLGGVGGPADEADLFLHERDRRRVQDRRRQGYPSGIMSLLFVFDC